jgi:hypothetical protein
MTTAIAFTSILNHNPNVVSSATFSYVSMGAKIERSEKYLSAIGRIDFERNKAADECNLGAVLCYDQAFELVADAEFLSSRVFPQSALERLAEAQSCILAAMRARA